MELYNSYIIKFESRYSRNPKYFTFKESDLSEIKNWENLDCTMPHLIGLLVTDKLDGYSLEKISWGKDGTMIQVNFDDFTNLQEDDAGFGITHNEALNNFIKTLNKPFYNFTT